MKSRTNSTALRIAAPLRALGQRFSLLLLSLAAIALMVAARLDAGLVEASRARVTDAVSPLLNIISRPVGGVMDAVTAVRDMAALYSENQTLRQENERLRQWHQVALRLEAENTSLRGLLAYRPDPAASYITARVVADPGGAFVRTLVVMAGQRDGVRRGQAAMTGSGLIGRVVQVGEWSSRILLITDINARIPVVLETSRQRAMLTGDNSDQPRLMYVPRDLKVTEGERVFTSGHGGLLPPGLPVGVVSTSVEGDIRVTPTVDPSRIEHVRLVDFGIPGGLAGEAAEAGAMR